MLNPIVALLHNTKLNRWHPIIFRESPLAVSSGEHVPVRHKSYGHHTAGFETRADAIAGAATMVEQVKPLAIGPVQLALSRDLPWDGEDVPASVAFFVKDSAGELVSAFG